MKQSKNLEPPPPGFRERFIADGWRGIERYYGARTNVTLRWIEECGGLEQLKRERREHYKQKALEVRRSVARRPR